MLISDILHNNVKAKLARDEVVASMTVRLVRTIEIARIAHPPASICSTLTEIRAPRPRPAGKLHGRRRSRDRPVRSRSRQHAGLRICRAEGGALGIIAPHVRSADEARAVVRAAKFSPLGERSNAGGLPHLHFRSFSAPEAYAALNEATMVIVQFESAAALDKTEEIVAVDGVDLVLVGLNDLLADWGIPGQYDHPRVREAYASTIAACRRHGKHCGVGGLSTRPDLVAEFVRMGARYVSTGTDLAFLMSACTARAKQVQEIKL